MASHHPITFPNAPIMTASTVLQLEEGAPLIEKSGWQRILGDATVQTRIAIFLCVFQALVYSWNGELLQAITSTNGVYESPQTTSPLLQMFLCHIGGLAFIPFFLKGPPLGVSDTTCRRMPFAAAFFTVLLMAGNYAAVRSYALISVSIATTIVQGSIAVVFVLSLCILRESNSLRNWLGVPVAIIGVCLTAEVFHEHRSVSGAGVLLAVAGSVGVALYQVCFQWAYWSLKNSPAFLAYFYMWVGVMHVFVVLPLILVANATGFEDLSFPTSAVLITGTLGSAVLASMNNLCQLGIMMWGGAMYLPASLLLSGPITLILDMTIHDHQQRPSQVIGNVMVLVSFFLLTDLVHLISNLKPAKAWGHEELSTSAKGQQ